MNQSIYNVLLIFLIGTLVFLGVYYTATELKSQEVQNDTIPPINNDSVNISQIQARFILMVRNITACSNISSLKAVVVGDTNRTFDMRDIKELNLTPKIYYYDLGVHYFDKLYFTFENPQNCSYSYAVVPNDYFISFLKSNGVPTDNTTVRKIGNYTS